MTTATLLQFLFVDSSVADVDTLLAGVDPSIQVVRLSGDQDGLAQIAQTLSGRSGIEAVHIVSHGGPGTLTLGNVTLGVAALGEHGASLAMIREALTEQADVLLYGCNVAQGEVGQAFIAALAEATGADVAASDNLTGASWLGGDWVLEAATGAIETATIEVPAMDTVLASGIFDNGFIKFGYSDDGSFGWGGNQSPGIFYDSTGSHTYPSNADFLTPGSPHEFFSVKIGSSTYLNNNSRYTSPGMPTTHAADITTADGKIYGSLTFTSLINGLEIVQTYSLGATDQVITVSVDVRNTTGSTVYGVKYARGIDPDVDSPLGTTSTNNVRGAEDIDASDIVLGTGPISGRVIGLYTNSSTAHNTHVSPGWSTDPAALLGSSSNNAADSTINLAFDLGDLAAGQTKTFSMAYVFAASAAALAESVAQVPPSNPPPTLTDFAAPVDSMDEDHTVELTFTELAAQGNQDDQNADGEPGSVMAFVVKAVSSGTLSIGTASETAVAWAPSSNDAIDSTHHAYWTPAANANGVLTAFKVVARDAEGAVSATAVPVTVNIAPVNDAPTLTSNAALAAIAEDAAVNNGASVAALFTPRFVDVDGDTLGGIVVVGNDADAAHGEWQYSIDAGNTWLAIGTVSEAEGLVLSAGSLLRFAPAADWHGEPDGLVVHAVDSAYEDGFTVGDVRTTFDTTTDAPTSGVSADSRTLTVNVTSVNDSPVFTSAPGAVALSETAANDTEAVLDTGSLSGTLTAIDVDHETAALRFSIRGGSDSEGIYTKVGQYGTLTVNSVSGSWTYTPGNLTAINALPEGASAVDIFDFKVVDPLGAATLQTLNVTLTGTNDVPVLVAAIADQSFAGSGTWQYQVPAATFTDSEGTGLTYTATLADDQPLPSWLSFDAPTRTFSGNPPAAWADASLSIRVTATDDEDATVSDTFALTLSGTANQPPVVANPLTWKAVDAVNEVTEVSLTGSLGGTTIVFDGETVQLGSAATGAQVATALQAAFDAAPGADYTAAIKGGGGNEHVLVLTANAAEARTDFTDGDTVAVSGGNYTVNVTTEGVSAVAEVVTVQFKTMPDGVTELIFDGITIPLWTAYTASQVAADAVSAINGNVASNWDAAVDTVQTDKVVLTARVAGARADLDTTSFVSDSPPATPVQSVVANQQGVDAVAEVVELVFTGSYGGAEITLDGVTGSAGSAVSAADVAAAVAAHSQPEMAPRDYPHFIITDAGDGVITVTAKTSGNQTDIKTADFGGSYTGTATPNVTTEGAGWSYAIPSGTFSDAEGDTLTYSAWVIDAVTSDASALTDSSALAFNEANATLSGDGLLPAGTLIEIRAHDPVSGGTASSQFQLVVYVDAQNATLVAGVMPSAIDFVDGAGSGRYTLPAAAFNYLDTADGALIYSATLDGGDPLPDWLTFDVATATFSGNPPNGTASVSVVVTATSASAGDLIVSTPAFELSIEQPNDPLVLSTPLADQSVAAGGDVSLAFTKPFTDPDGGNGGTPTTDGITYSATANGLALSDFGLSLSFLSGQMVINGKVPGGTPSLNIVVTGTETTGGTSASTSFTLHLGGDADEPTHVGTLGANQPGTVTISGIAKQGETLTASVPSDADGYSGGVVYQWQVSADGTHWSDIAGSRGTNVALTLAESESGRNVRVQAFYTDNGQTAEAPVSGAVEVENVNDDGVVGITGAGVPGQTLSATLSDPDGLVDVTPTYQWLRDGVVIVGATYSAYTLSADDGGALIGVRVTYTDNHDTAEVVTYTKPEPIQLGAVAPVAVNDTASATEAGGLANAIPGSDATGNLLDNDTDANEGDTLSITGLRLGVTEGLGRPASDNGGDLVITGDYGTLRVNKATGAYTYEVEQDNESVQAMGLGDSIVETFNYTVTDSSFLSDTAKLTITIHGANDLPTVAGIEASAVVAEDVATALRLPLTITDPDGDGHFALELHVTNGTLRAVSDDEGLTLSGSDTGTLTITAGNPMVLQSWLTAHSVFYVTAPNAHGTDIATLSYRVDDGSGFVALPETTSISATNTNDAAIIDLDGTTPGNHFTTLFRPRGAEVAVVADSVSIVDIDPGDTLMSAAVTITGGDFDNAFGTTYETLRSTLGAAFMGSLGEIAITGNGSGEYGLTGATQLTFTGAGTQQDYQDALKTVFYNNSNPNAFAGDRTITVSVSDVLPQASNASVFSIMAADDAIVVGQRIFIGDVDSGYTVATKVDELNFVASGPLKALDAGSTLTFYEAGDLVATATQSGPTIATTTVQVPWTPVIDMSGEALAGRDHAVTYTEGHAGVAIATSDASITDQDGNIATVTVTLTNPIDDAAEKLFIVDSLVTTLRTMGIAVEGNGTHQIVLRGDKDATFFQIGLRGVQYANTSHHPSADTQRIVEVTSTDVDGYSGVGAQTVINLVAVNDAPTGADATLTLVEDTAKVLSVADFGYADIDGNAFASITVVSVLATGSLLLDGADVSIDQRITVADIADGKLVYVPATDASGVGIANFQFRVQDDGGTAPGGIDLAAAANTLTFDVTPSNDAPVMTPAGPSLITISEDDVAAAGQRVSDFVGTGAGKTGVTDVDTLNNDGAGYSPEAVGQGIAIHALANEGPATGGVWEYSLDDGDDWTAVGAVGADSALLLGASDRIRFVPDGENAATASFSYYLWDGAAGTAGNRFDASMRGGASAFSEGSDTARISVTAVNDAPTIDLNGAAAGTGFTAIFRPRGDEVAVVGQDIVISDVDRLDADTPDTLVSANVRLINGALDNLFGTTYETLRSSAGHTTEGSLGSIVITGNGSGDHGLTGATALTFNGAGTHADYEAALKTVLYGNANPNAYSGDRTIEITVRDASVGTGDAGDGLDSAVATTTVQVPWTPVIDLNGNAMPGRNASIVFTEGSAGVAIAASDASIVDQDGNIATVTIRLTNPLDGSAEKLFVASALVTQLGLAGITVVGNDSHAITLTGNRDATVFQLALRAIRYVNASDNADLTPRVVSVDAVDMQGNTGVGAQTVINITPVNDAPQGVAALVTLDEDTGRSFELADFGYTDAEGDALASVRIATLPDSGSLTLDGNAVAAGQEITSADIEAGKLVYTPAANANGTAAASFTFQVRDDGGTANGGVDLDPVPRLITININPVNDEPTSSGDPHAAPSVSISGSLRESHTLTAVLDLADVDRSPTEITAATSLQWQVRVVPHGAWTDLAGANGNTFTLTNDERFAEVRVVASYEDVADPLSVIVFDSARADRPAIIADESGNIVLNADTDMPILIVNPQGDVTVTNIGDGGLTVEGFGDDSTLSVSGPGTTTVSNPLGDLNIVNAGSGIITVTDPVDGSHVTTSGGGAVVIYDPQGSLFIDNAGPAAVTVVGLDDGESIDVSGSGPVTVADAGGNITITNHGEGVVTATGLDEGSLVTTSGTGPIDIYDPDGSLELDNQGPGTVKIEGINDGESLVVGGSGQTTVSNPDGDLTLTNNGTGYVTVTGIADDAAVTTAGTGDVFITQPHGNLELVNDLIDGGDVYLNRPQDGATLSISGAGGTTVSNPNGDLTLVNDGPGLVTARCVLDGKTVTTSGVGDVLISNSRGSLALVNEGPGTATVDGIHPGSSVAVSGSGPTTVANPDGDITVTNNGTGLVTTTGVEPHRTVTFEGNGPQALDLTGFAGGDPIILDNRGGANIEVLNAPDAANVQATGSGDLTVTAPAGDIFIDNSGAGTVHVEQVIDGAAVIKTGSGPAVIDHPAGSFTLDNDATGLVTVRNLDAGQTLVVEGSGPVAVESNLASGEHVRVDISANSNVQLSNLGAGTIDLLGDLQLDSGDPLSIKLNGDGTTALTVTGEVSLDGTPLDLQLDAAYAPHLGDTITLLDNDGADSVSGTFAGLPEGAPVSLGGQLFQISYVGGTGNDVVLTRINDAPTGSVTVTGAAAQGQTLTASHTLADTDGMGSVRYQWLADGALLAVGSSYVVSQEAVGKAITVVASYIDAEGSEESVSSAPSALVTNVNDTPTGQALIAGTAVLGQTLVASNTLDDADGMGEVSYQWQVDGVDITGATGGTHMISSSDIGKAISVMASYVDGQGTAERVASASTSAVLDGSGVASSVQSQVPTLGDSALKGDGNGDGIPDVLQPNVVSAPLERSGGGASSFVTLVVDSVNGKPQEGSVARIVDFAAITTPDLPSWAQAPTDGVGFTAHVRAPGVTENFSLYVDPSLGINGYWAKNAEGVLVNLASEAYGGRTVVDGDKLRLDFQITEGGEFDAGPAGDMTITSSGVAAHASLSLIGYTLDQSSTADAATLWG